MIKISEVGSEMDKSMEYSDKLKNCWVETYTSNKVYPFNPKPEQIQIEDIAHALSMICRYTGHCKRFYSVAEHSIHVAGIVPIEYKLPALLHDASEAYLGDISRPVKAGMPYYKDLEKQITEVIYKAFKIAPFDDSLVKKADNILLGTEAKLLMFHVEDWYLDEEPLAWDSLPCFSPGDSKMIFMHMFNLYKTSYYNIQYRKNKEKENEEW